MASVDVSQLSKQEHDELTCAYAALLLHDDGLEITVSKSQHINNSLKYLNVIGREISQGYQGKWK